MPAGGRAAHHLSDRDGDERHARRRARAVGLERRALHRLCRIRLEHRDLPRRQQVAERLSLVQTRLPRGVQTQMGPISSVMGEIMLIAMTSTGTSPMDLREIADFVVRPQLLTIPGIAQVIPIGGEVRQYRITPDPVAMTRLAVTPQQIEQAVQRFGTNTGGGFVDQHSANTSSGPSVSPPGWRTCATSSSPRRTARRSSCARSRASISRRGRNGATPATRDPCRHRRRAEAARRHGHADPCGRGAPCRDPADTS